MLEKKAAAGRAKIYAAFAAAVIIALAAASFVFLSEGPPQPGIADVKIVKRQDRLVANYKKSGPGGRGSEELINWYFNGTEQPRLKGMFAIPVPPVADTTVEIECAIRRIDQTSVSKPVRSKKYRHYVKSGPGPADPSATAETKIQAAEPEAQSASGVAAADTGENTAAPDRPAGTAKNAGAEAQAPVSGPAAAAETAPPVPAAVEPAAVNSSVENNVSSGARFEDRPATFKPGGGNVFKSNSSETANAESAKPAEAETPAPKTCAPPVKHVPPVPPYVNVNVSIPASPEIINGVIIVHRTLHEAIAKDDLDQARLMIGAGRDVNAMDGNGQRPIHVAVSMNSPEFVELLLDNRADIRARDYKGKTPLHVAASKRKALMTDILLKKEKEFAGRETCQVTLLGKKFVNSADYEGQTPLHVAAIYDAREAAALLIADSAEVNAKDSKQSTPLHYAVLNKSRKIIPLLIENGADVNAADQYGQTPVYFAEGEILQMLRPDCTGENSIKKTWK